MLFIGLEKYLSPMSFNVRKGFMDLLVSINTHDTHQYHFEPSL